MRKPLILLGVLSIGYAYAQRGNMGINTLTPKSTLDINPNTDNAKAEAKTNEGILAPRLSKARIANIDNANLVEGTLVYATDTTYTGANTKVAKITEKGYYFYNGTEWVKASAGADTNIYTSNGTLSGHRTVDMAGRNLYFTNNGRIGIGTTAPSSAITIDGTGGWNDDITINTYGNTTGGFSLYSNKHRGTAENKVAVEVGDSLGNFNFRGYNGTALANGGTINAVVSEIDGTNVRTNILINPTKNVGIGTNSPSQKLEVGGGVLAASFIARTSNNVGGWIELDNPSKEGTEVSRWRIYNMTNKDNVGSTKYTNGLHFWAYAADDTNLGSQMILTDEGKLGIGFGSNTNTEQNLKEKLEVNGKIRATSLQGSTGVGDRIVYADEKGVLKVGDANTGATTLTGEKNLVCNEANRGKMNFVKDVTIGTGTGDAFAICLKGTDGNHYWRYLYGGGGETTGGGAFGTGLQ